MERALFNILNNDLFIKCYNLSENLAVNGIIVKFYSWLLFMQYVPKTNRTFSIKIYKFSKMTKQATHMT